MKFFIPEEKQKYVLLEDWDFLLYPFNWNVFGLNTEWFSGTLIDGLFKYDDPFKVCKYTDPDWIEDPTYHYRPERCIVDWFLLTDQEYSEHISRLVKSREDLLAFGKADDIKIIYTEWHGQGKNKDYHVFSKTIKSRNKFDWPDNKNKEKNKFSPDTDSRLKIATDYWEEEKNINAKIFSSANNMGALWDNEIEGYIPINYKFSKGTEFMVKKLKYKHGRTKALANLVRIVIDGKEISILKEDFNKMDVELVSSKTKKKIKNNI